MCLQAEPGVHELLGEQLIGCRGYLFRVHVGIICLETGAFKAERVPSVPTDSTIAAARAGVVRPRSCMQIASLRLVTGDQLQRRDAATAAPAHGLKLRIILMAC